MPLVEIRMLQPGAGTAGPMFVNPDLVQSLYDNNSPVPSSTIMIGGLSYHVEGRATDILSLLHGPQKQQARPEEPQQPVDEARANAQAEGDTFHFSETDSA